MDNVAAQMVIKLGYRGEGFCGFAIQPEERTVAGELKRALETFLRHEVFITCAGRTDTGVHAQSQYVSIPVTQEELALDKGRLMRGLSALTPDDISIIDIYKADKEFSARFSAQARHYRYRISSGAAKPIVGWDYSWWYRGELDVDKMHEAAQYLLGENDFKSFCKAQSAIGKPTHRYVDSLTVTKTHEMNEDFIAIDICGNAFLHSMVRTITGSLVEVGRGNKDPEWIKDVLKACDRSAAGPCAPAKGLIFVGVDYPEGSLLSW